MAELQHFSHGCALTSPEMAVVGVCNICFKDEPVELACKPCNFDLCKSCSNLPQTVSHDFHPNHPLEFSLRQFNRKPLHVICSWCGNMFTGSFYECKECEIYLDLDCAILKNIFTAWDAKEKLHYSHHHLLKSCRPGNRAKFVSCVLCEVPLSPSAICYGCVYCGLYFHEACLLLPTKIQHPVHPAHPLRRLSFENVRGGGRKCDACRIQFADVPFGCLECNFDLHLRCADSLLRGLVHKSHEHRLFYVATNASIDFGKVSPCQICMRTDVISLDSYYRCAECDLMFHFECLEIPQSVVKKSCHIHPLVCEVFMAKDDCKVFIANDDLVDYCGVCETIVNKGHHTYSCKECDFLGHIECILREEEPSPLYLKDLYSVGKDDTRLTNQEDHETNNLKDKLVVNDYNHAHVMRPAHMSELHERTVCNICDKEILGSLWKCETCSFQTHMSCAELGKPSIHRFHLNHPLSLLPKNPGVGHMYCANCRQNIRGFNLYCRICDFIIDISCVLKGSDSPTVLGHKITGTSTGLCMNLMSSVHSMVQIIISSSCHISCVICDDRVYGKALSCVECQEIYHPLCIKLGRKKLFGHPLHYDHTLEFLDSSGSTCNACKLKVAKYGYNCRDCKVNFHLKCIKATTVSGKLRVHRHLLYNFWIDNSRVTPDCTVCNRPCGASFYGCVGCNYNAHVKCIGLPDNVKNKLHQHTLRTSYDSKKCCSLCGLEFGFSMFYTCVHCEDTFHKECILALDKCEPATEEEQLQDIYLMYLEIDLYYLLKDDKVVSKEEDLPTESPCCIS
ncbi:unnamed protein product [Microthlaspi erraticum]|uniref:Phorbol-ester/DAG-type domain-containing protein n=1 Tax=Microthlaspi erraticum TaxID=1685480 RepID=A0A6D2JY22_9BRAS|nr:unnamed protein product [Microthlaspi erraticum]